MAMSNGSEPGTFSRLAGRIGIPAVGPLALIAAAFLWGTSGVTGRYMQDAFGAGPTAVAFVRLAVSAPTLLALSAGLRQWGAGGVRSLVRGRTVLAACFVAVYQVLYFAAVARSGVTTATLLALCPSPIYAALIARVALRERLTRNWWQALGPSLIGTALIVSAPWWGSGPGSLAGHGIRAGADGGDLLSPAMDGLVPTVATAAHDVTAWWGVALAVGAGLTYACYTVLGRELTQRHPPVTVMAVFFSLGALLLVPFAIGESFRWLSDVAVWPSALYIGCVGTGLAYALFGIGLKTVPAGAAGMYTLAEPLTAAVLSVMLLGERLDVFTAAGGASLVAGLWILSRRGSTRRAAAGRVK